MTTTPAPTDHDAIRERAITFRANQLQHEKTHDRATALTAAAILCAQDVPALLAELAEARRERDEAHASLGRIHELIDSYERQRRFFITSNELRKLLAEVPSLPTVANVLASDLAEANERLTSQRDAAREELTKVTRERDEVTNDLRIARNRLATAEKIMDEGSNKIATISEELAKVRVELTNAHAEADMWMRQLEELTKAAGDYQKRAEEELTKARAELDTRTLWHYYATCGYCGAKPGKPCHHMDETRTVLARSHLSRDVLANPATTAEPDAPKTTCHLPIQNSEPCGLAICRKNGCRVAPDAEPAAG